MESKIKSFFSLVFVFLLSSEINYGSAAAAKTESKNILFYMGCGSYSMRISVWPLVEALSNNGHKVTFISSYEPKTPNPVVHDFVPKKLQEWWSEMEGEIDVYELRKNGMLIPFWFTCPSFGIEVCKKLYEDPEAVKWIQTSKFDLVFIDSFMNECAYGLAHVFQAKTIVLSTTLGFPWWYDNFGIPDDSSWAMTDSGLGLSASPANFFTRAISAVMPVVWKGIREWWYLPELEKLTRNALKLDTMPSFREMEKNTSLSFVTTHYSQELARAFPPNVIPIGGLAITEKLSPLPKEMQDFIDKGKHGFIYISFGTVGEFSSLDNTTKEAFVNAVLRFPHIQFIWKSTKGVGVELPENFMVLKWVPQQTLLAHPKIKAFVTHAGLGSINEALYFGVTLICFPIFAEQDHNANLLETKGIGIKLELTQLKAEHLEHAIKEMTQSQRMKENMLKVSRLFKDRPQSALQTSLWWTEFVLKHDTSEIKEFLHPLNVNQPWWVRRQLDVWLFIGTIFLLLISIILYALKWLVMLVVRTLFKSSAKNARKVKQN